MPKPKKKPSRPVKKRAVKAAKKPSPRKNIWMDPALHVEGVALAERRKHRSFSELLSFLVRREVEREKAEASKATASPA